MGGSGRKLEDIPDDDWQLAVDRQATIRRLADLDIITKDDVRAASEELGLGRSRIFELVANYRKHGGGASSIASKRRGPKEGASRLSEELDEFIYASIDRFYGRRQKPKIADLCLEIATDCNERGWKAPSRAAVEARIARLDRAGGPMARRPHAVGRPRGWASGRVEGGRYDEDDCASRAPRRTCCARTPCRDRAPAGERSERWVAIGARERARGRATRLLARKGLCPVDGLDGAESGR